MAVPKPASGHAVWGRPAETGYQMRLRHPAVEPGRALHRVGGDGFGQPGSAGHPTLLLLRSSRASSRLPSVGLMGNRQPPGGGTMLKLALS